MQQKELEYFSFCDFGLTTTAKLQKRPKIRKPLTAFKRSQIEYKTMANNIFQQVRGE